MADPPRRITEKGTELVLVNPLDPKLKAEERQALMLPEMREIEEGLLQTSANIIGGALAFPEITPETETPPDAWIEALGFKKANEKLRIAKAAWMSTKDAPVGLKLALQTYNGILRVRAGDHSNATLNYTVVELAVPPPQFPEKEVEGRK